ncbi:c-type cytochrome [Halothiobacillus neapolitanus]|jgi:cytochrome c556|uniref:Cytochrome c prime n=1 Tax=Halothiobacillus neapolitanus (strain ATCC 23641 / DSM 15147 / CIP 104769 / NCIMB 8539 / c2) TaxID=555778 RepID=D0KZT6_HALNC|nr:cytochrome c [Halothiobacillus neapolitanus]ACX95959.1 cytochrome c prime [Halothiobacillus neapolitanus c2]TDN66267.1 cytochrome c556 [Halothiobacillus neapolitanus]
MRLVKFAVAAALGLSVAVGSFAAADSMTDAIKYRQSMMEVTGYNFKMMAAMVKKEMPYNKADFEKMASTVHTMSMLTQDGFPKGSDSMAAPTHAKDAVWSEPEKFNKDVVAFQKASAALVVAAKTGDMSQIGPQFKETAGTCKKCHDSFRSKSEG